ncbi:MAG: hypothetical protein MJ094_09050 [Saccharofermentans sp.]|nr:hypothetical protein [Saccharofermentans sp.]
MSDKTFIKVFCIVALIGVLSALLLFVYTVKLQKEASIIAIVANEGDIYETR